MNTDIITIATYYQPHQAESKEPCHIDEKPCCGSDSDSYLGICCQFSLLLDEFCGYEQN